MKKIVINKSYGSFGLSRAAYHRLCELGNDTALSEDEGKPGEKVIFCMDIPRDDPQLIRVLMELGDEAPFRYCRLVIIEIPDDVDWEIEDYDGDEWVSEKHRTWGK